MCRDYGILFITDKVDPGEWGITTAESGNPNGDRPIQLPAVLVRGSSPPPPGVCVAELIPGKLSTGRSLL